jgi:excisionase family DNA binding protein
MIQKKKARRGGELGMSVDEFAEALGISRASAYQAIKRGQVPHWRLLNRIVIGRAVVARMLDDRDGDV